MTLYEIPEHITYNALLKSFPDGSATLYVAERAIFRAPGWEPVRRKRKRWELDDEVEEFQYIQAEREGKYMEASDYVGPKPWLEGQRRARSRLRDICRASSFKWFVTLTLDAQRIERYDIAEILRHLKGWLDNRVRRYGLAYVLVPEHHKDGAIHFHGFFNDALDRWMVPSGLTDGNGNDIYNCESWGYGFTTAIQLYGEYTAAVAYVCKYIGKQTEKIGGRWYYSGGKLGRPTVRRYNLDSMPEGGWPFEVSALGVQCKAYEIKPDGSLA